MFLDHKLQWIRRAFARRGSFAAAPVGSEVFVKSRLALYCASGSGVEGGLAFAVLSAFFVESDFVAAMVGLRTARAFSTVSSAHTGAWSLGLSLPRSLRSTPASSSFSECPTRMWSMRSPASRSHRLRR